MSKRIVEDYKQGVESHNGDMFVYSSYWHTWSRVLRERSGGNPTIEVDLTAINPTADYGWARVLSCNIREHYTHRGTHDIICRSLPAHAVLLMRERMDSETFDKLVHQDLLPLIDWDKYREVCNGGAALKNILK
jgi:hypothetical protein